MLGTGKVEFETRNPAPTDDGPTGRKIGRSEAYRRLYRGTLNGTHGVGS
jgi:hypothetical protein